MSIPDDDVLARAAAAPPDPPMKEHPPEIVICAFCGYPIEDAWWPYHPCPEREEAQAERKRLDEAAGVPPSPTLPP